MAALAYTIREHQGVQVEQRNIRTCFAQGNMYAHVHLSKVSYQPTDAPLFETVLSTVQMVDAPGAPGQFTPTPSGSSLDLFKRGSEYFLQTHYRNALPFYQQALELEKVSPQLNNTYRRVLINNLGVAYGLTGQWVEAKVTFDYGITVDPQYPLFHYNLACSYAEMGALEDAKRTLDTAFRYRNTLNPGEDLPDPQTDTSFQRYMTQPDVRLWLDQLVARSN